MTSRSFREADTHMTGAMRPSNKGSCCSTCSSESDPALHHPPSTPALRPEHRTLSNGVLMSLPRRHVTESLRPAVSAQSLSLPMISHGAHRGSISSGESTSPHDPAISITQTGPCSAHMTVRIDFFGIDSENRVVRVPGIRQFVEDELAVWKHIWCPCEERPDQIKCDATVDFDIQFPRRLRRSRSRMTAFFFTDLRAFQDATDVPRYARTFSPGVTGRASSSDPHEFRMLHPEAGNALYTRARIIRDCILRHEMGHALGAPSEHVPHSVMGDPAQSNCDVVAPETACSILEANGICGPGAEHFCCPDGFLTGIPTWIGPTPRPTPGPGHTPPWNPYPGPAGGTTEPRVPNNPLRDIPVIGPLFERGS